MSGKYKILIVEDSLFQQRILSTALGEDYTLKLLDRGSDILQHVQSFQPSLILLDIILADISGFEVLKTLKESNDSRTIPVLIITNLDSTADEEKGLRMGAMDYIRKPFSVSVLKARVKNHIQIVKQIETIEQLGYIDVLTELPNRRKFDYLLTYEWHRSMRKQTHLGILMIDIDSFKHYNDTYGHAQGDMMMQELGRILNITLERSTDVACRWGGEEFAVLIPEASEQELMIVAEKIRKNIADIRIPTAQGESITCVTASIGALLAAPQRTDNKPNCIEQVDKLLYKAKARGKNQVQFGVYCAPEKT